MFIRDTGYMFRPVNRSSSGLQQRASGAVLDISASTCFNKYKAILRPFKYKNIRIKFAMISWG